MLAHFGLSRTESETAQARQPPYALRPKGSHGLLPTLASLAPVLKVLVLLEHTCCSYLLGDIKNTAVTHRQEVEWSLAPADFMAWTERGLEECAKAACPGWSCWLPMPALCWSENSSRGQLWLIR